VAAKALLADLDAGTVRNDALMATAFQRPQP
jgi:hypothetical protein